MTYQLGKSIVATVTYYDVMDFPLTAFEIWKHLINYDQEVTEKPQETTVFEVWQALQREQLAQRIESKDGLYFLYGRSELVRERIRREKLSVQKLRRLRRLAGWLAVVPYIRMIGATGSLSMKHGTSGSDWDMFVVLRSGKIWTGRTLLTLILQCMGKRRHGKKISNRACLNYFVTDEHLEITSKDLFSAHEYHFMIPLLSFPLFQTFEIKNRWMKRFKPNYILTTLPSVWLTQQKAYIHSLQRSLEHILDRLNLERWLCSWQQERIALNPKTYLEGSLIEASDQALIFLPTPRGPRVFQKFKDRLSI